MISRSDWKLVIVVVLSVCGASSYPVKGLASDSAVAAPATGRVMTVNGLMDPGTVGQTLIHEHIFIDSMLPDDFDRTWAMAGRVKPRTATQVALYNAPLTLENLFEINMGAANRDNYFISDEGRQESEVGAFGKVAGFGATIVEVTSIGLKRNPEALRRVSKATGINIVMGTGWASEAWSGPLIKDRTVESLTDEIVHDVTVGVGESGIQSGIIGEIGVTGGPLSEGEIKIIRASGRASRRTGAAILLAVSGHQGEREHAVGLLIDEGADLHRVVVGHSNPIAKDIRFMVALLERGVYLAFDTLGRRPTVNSAVSDYDVALAIVELLKAGYAERILLSQGVSSKNQLQSYGGAGYSYVVESFVPQLRRLGVTDEQIHTILVENPQKLLAFAAPQLS